MREIAICTAAVFIIQLSARATEDWPQFRGPTGQGISKAEKVPTKWGPKDGVVWKKELPGKGWSSPVISDGKVVMTASKKQGEKITLAAMALDAGSGKILWEKELFTPTEKEARARHSKNGLASSTPWIEAGVVYVHFAHMGTAALKLENGDVLWTEKVDYEPVHGTGSSPVLVDGLLVFHADGASDPTLVALNATSGEVEWRVKRNQEVKKTFSFSTPLVVEVDGQKQIISQASGMVGAYAPSDGRLIWKVRYGEGYSVVPRPVFANGLIYVATGFDRPNLMAIRPNGAKGDVTESHVVWEEEKWIPKTPSFVQSDGHLYLVDDGGNVTCRDAGTGELNWREKAPGNYSSSPVLVGDTLYIATEDGVVYVLKVSPTEGNTVAEIDMKDRIFASPAVVNGAIFIRSEGHLWKISG